MAAPAAAVEEPDLFAGADPGRPGQVAVLVALEDDPLRALGDEGDEELVGGHASRRSHWRMFFSLWTTDLSTDLDVLPAELGQLAEQGLLLLGQVLRRLDEDLDEEIALAPPGDVLDALALEADRLARLRPGRDLEDLVPLERRDLHPGAEGGLGEGHGDLAGEVVPLRARRRDACGRG